MGFILDFHTMFGISYSFCCFAPPVCTIRKLSVITLTVLAWLPHASRAAQTPLCLFTQRGNVPCFHASLHFFSCHRQWSNWQQDVTRARQCNRCFVLVHSSGGVGRGGEDASTSDQAVVTEGERPISSWQLRLILDLCNDCVCGKKKVTSSTLSAATTEETIKHRKAGSVNNIIAKPTYNFFTHITYALELPVLSVIKQLFIILFFFLNLL